MIILRSKFFSLFLKSYKNKKYVQCNEVLTEDLTIEYNLLSLLIINLTNMTTFKNIKLNDKKSRFLVRSEDISEQHTVVTDVCLMFEQKHRICKYVAELLFVML